MASLLSPCADDVEKGKRRINRPPMFKEWDFLKNEHVNQFKDIHAPADINQVPIRFRAGFTRRQEESIGITAQRKELQEKSEQRTQINLEKRRKEQQTRSSINGNVIIGGDLLNVAVKVEGKKKIEPFTSGYAKAEAGIRIRSSDMRFFQPSSDIPKRDYPFSKPTQYSSELGVGRAELLSNGVRDNFSNDNTIVHKYSKKQLH